MWLTVFISILLLASPASAFTAYVCRGQDTSHIRTGCRNGLPPDDPADPVCIIVGYYQPYDTCTEGVDSTGAEYQEYLQRQVTPAVEDEEFRRSYEASTRNDIRWRVWMMYEATQRGITPRALMDELNTIRRNLP